MRVLQEKLMAGLMRGSKSRENRFDLAVRQWGAVENVAISRLSYRRFMAAK
jgi:hypothetical protein